MKAVFLAGCLFLGCSGSAVAEYKASVVFDDAADKEALLVRKSLESSAAITDVTAFLNEKFALTHALTIRLGGEDGPLYDPGANEIVVPYSFIEAIRQRFKADGYAKSGVSVDEAVVDALMHTLFHEIGHALVSMYDLPVLGKEEDAVDGLATILLIEYFEQGEEIALSAADLFNMESGDVGEFSHEDFWDEHSLDIQRYYSTLCFVYGSSPAKYAYLKETAEFSDERADLCIDEYQNAARDWFALLEQHFKPD